MMSQFTLNTETPFSFKSTLFSHGWIDLAPFKLHQDQKQLQTFLRLDKTIVNVSFSSSNDKDILVQAGASLSAPQKELLTAQIRHMFRLDESYADFFEMAAANKDFVWIVEKRAGRMFRCATLWEDMVKMVCTTNCTWNLTKIMVQNLVEKIGAGVFPLPAQIAEKSETYLRKQIKLGYRAPYILEFSKAITTGLIDLNLLINWSGDAAGLYKEILKIKGFGAYAASNLLKLLGRYDYYGADSWSRKKFSEKYMNSQPCSDTDIALHYDRFGPWRGLFFWLDMTREWYESELPW